MDFPERDWKHLRVVHRAALERYCERVLKECEAVLANASRTAHQRYLDLFELTRDRDRELAYAFDDMRRSRALERLMAMQALGVVTDEEMAGFSEETKEEVAHILELRRELSTSEKRRPRRDRPAPEE
jgi:ABC-type branched-subunit amino acid transport system ATPase component